MTHPNRQKTIQELSSTCQNTSRGRGTFQVLDTGYLRIIHLMFSSLLFGFTVSSSSHEHARLCAGQGISVWYSLKNSSPSLSVASSCIQFSIQILPL